MVYIPAVFFEGLFNAINYTSSFLFMQVCGFTLATKQPSMTAPALAARMKSIIDREQLDSLVTDIAAMTRSNFAAALGNVGMVIPGVIAFDFFYFNWRGTHVLDALYAEKLVKSFDPFLSPTIPLAAMTGVILWLASLSAGWFENWVVYRKLPDSLAQNRRLIKFFGKDRNHRLSAWFCRNVAGMASNVSIGTMLAIPTMAGRFFGLTLDVRHVTLSAGALTFAFIALWDQDAVTVFQSSKAVFSGLWNFLYRSS